MKRVTILCCAAAMLAGVIAPQAQATWAPSNSANAGAAYWLGRPSGAGQIMGQTVQKRFPENYNWADWRIEHRGSAEAQHDIRLAKEYRGKGAKLRKNHGGWKGVGEWAKRTFGKGPINDKAKKAARRCGGFGLLSYAVYRTEGWSKEASIIAGANSCLFAAVTVFAP